jgi:hypothetical protein
VLRLVASQRGIAALKAAAKLSRDHAAALWLYTCESALYRKLNELLRARNRAALMAGFFPYLRLLLEAFAALETPKPRMVNRGVARDLVAAHPELYAKGSELTWWGFSSTTKDIAVLQVRSARCAAHYPRARRAGSGTVDGASLPRHYPRRGRRRTRCSSARPATARSSRSSRAAASTSRRSRRCAERRRRGSHALVGVSARAAAGRGRGGAAATGGDRAQDHGRAAEGRERPHDHHVRGRRRRARAHLVGGHGRCRPRPLCPGQSGGADGLPQTCQSGTGAAVTPTRKAATATRITERLSRACDCDAMRLSCYTNRPRASWTGANTVSDSTPPAGRNLKPRVKL